MAPFSSQTNLGVREVYGKAELFGLDETDRLQHLYLVGKSGSGKTTCMRNMIIQDIEAGRGVGFIDPHGDEAERLLDEIPSWRTDDFVYFNPIDPSHVPGLNLLEVARPESRPLVAASVVSNFAALWRDSWGPRSEYILYNVVAALLEFPIEKGGATLLGVPRMLADENYRERVLSHVRDARVLAFWKGEFAGWGERLQGEAVAPLQNKAGRLLTPVLRHVLGQVRSTIRPREIMDRGMVFVANLAKGRIGEGDSSLLGSLLVTRFLLDAMERADVDEGERRAFHLSVDEFHNFTTESFPNALSEARKYGLGFTLGNQFLEQLARGTRDALLGNVGSLVCFRVGADDADALARELEPLSPSTLRELGRGEVCARLLRGGQPTDSFTGSTLPPIRRGYDRRGTLLSQSKQRYGTPREEIEARLARWGRGRE